MGFLGGFANGFFGCLSLMILGLGAWWAIAVGKGPIILLVLLILVPVLWLLWPAQKRFENERRRQQGLPPLFPEDEDR